VGSIHWGSAVVGAILGLVIYHVLIARKAGARG
jgi:hypothetical protein